MDVVEHVAERRRPELAERVAQVHAALAAAAEAEPAAQALGRLHALVADRVLRDRLAELLGAREVRPRAAVREPVGVVGVEQQAADAGLELAADRALLQRREPARERHRHRVVRGRERDLVERPVAQVGVAVAARDLRRRGRVGAAGRHEPGAHAATMRRRRDGHGDRREPPARAHARGADAGRGRRSAAGAPPRPCRARRCRRAWPRSAGRPRARRSPGRPRRSGRRAGDPRAHTLRLGAEPAPGGAQRPLDPDGPDDAAAAAASTAPTRPPASRRSAGRRGTRPTRAAGAAASVAGTVEHDGRATSSTATTTRPAAIAASPTRAAAPRRPGDRHGGERRDQRQRGEHERQHPHVPARRARSPVAAPRSRLSSSSRSRDSSRAASGGSSWRSAAAATMPTSASVSVTVSRSRWKTAPWTSRTARRNRLAKASPPTAPATADAISGRAVSRSGSRGSTSSSVTRSAIAVRTPAPAARPWRGRRTGRSRTARARRTRHRGGEQEQARHDQEDPRGDLAGAHRALRPARTAAR